MKISIVGLGLIGGSIAQGLKSKHQITGFDPDKNTQAAATKAGINMATDLSTLVKDAELVIVAAPTKQSEETLKELKKINYTGIVTDICSVKASLLVAAEGLNYVGSHPMAGSNEAGFNSASKDLFIDAPWAISVVSETNKDALIEVINIISELGGFVVPVDPHEHDESVVLSSHLAHVVASAYAKSVGESEFAQLAQLLAGGSFRDLTRVTTSPAERTAEIVWPNRKSLSRVVENLGENLAKLQNLLDQGSQADIEKFLSSASSLRTISDATMAKVKNKQGNKVVSKADDLVSDFLKYSKSRVIASDFQVTNNEVNYLVNEI
jgi:prephenate dehydrogenase